jgi:hypothetical protein
MFSRFAFHTTGVILMVLAVFVYHDTRTKRASNNSTEPSPTYSLKQESYCMRDLEINIGYVGNDIIALCEDHDASYSFIATRGNKVYTTRLSSSASNLTSSTSYPLNSGARQMVMGALVNYWSAVEQMQKKAIEKQRKAALKMNPTLN